jgi:hypothetical protein
VITAENILLSGNKTNAWNATFITAERPMMAIDIIAITMTPTEKKIIAMDLQRSKNHENH